MQQKKVSERLEDKSSFVVVVGLSSGAGFNFGPIETFLNAYESGGNSVISADFSLR